MTKNRNRKQAVRHYQQTHDVPYLKAARRHDATTPLPSVPGDLPDMLPFPEPGSREFDEAIRLARDGILRIGIDDTGQWVDWDLNSNPHGLISGKTGSGKTQLLTAIAFYAAWLPDEYELVVCDPKGTDLTWTAGASNVVWYAATAVEIPEAIAYVRKQIIERQERSRSTQRNDSSEPAPPRLILLINDLTVVLANSSESMDGPTQRAREHLELIARTGRAVDVNVVGSAQEVTAKVMPDRMRSLMVFRLMLGSLDDHRTQTVLDMSERQAQTILDFDRAASPPRGAATKGRGWVRNASGYQRMQAIFLPVEDRSLPGSEVVTVRGARPLLQEHLSNVGRTPHATAPHGGTRLEPPSMVIVYLARGDDETLVCVAAEEDQEPRFFVGSGSPLREVPLAGGPMERFQVLSDGGTTEVTTTEGIFYVPTPLRHSPYKPGGVTWQGRPFTLMDVGTTSAYLTSEGLVLH